FLIVAIVTEDFFQRAFWGEIELFGKIPSVNHHRILEECQQVWGETAKLKQGGDHFGHQRRSRWDGNALAPAEFQGFLIRHPVVGRHVEHAFNRLVQCQHNGFCHIVDVYELHHRGEAGQHRCSFAGKQGAHGIAHPRADDVACPQDRYVELRIAPQVDVSEVFQFDGVDQVGTQTSAFQGGGFVDQGRIVGYGPVYVVRGEYDDAANAVFVRQVQQFLGAQYIGVVPAHTGQLTGLYPSQMNHAVKMITSEQVFEHALVKIDAVAGDVIAQVNLFTEIN